MDAEDRREAAPAQSHFQRARERLLAARNVHQPTIIEGLRWAATILIALVAAVVIAICFLDWNTLRGPIARYASYRIGRPVRIAGDLKVHLWSFTPRVSADGVSIGNPSWVRTPRMAQVQNLTFKIRLLPYLFGGQTYLPLVSIDHPDILVVRDGDGRTNWDFDDGADTGEGAKIPPIQHFIVRDGHLQIRDFKRKLTFVGQVTSHEDTGRGAAFVLSGDGVLNGRKFGAVLRGGPLINVDVTRPYGFYADVHEGATHVVARGSITHPFDLGGIEATLTLSGPNLNQLYDLTGLALPGTPPYRLTGHFIR
ncbi:MAG TPA: AsmA family protein, partial [Rhizomicrobium sp.]|nr:AsmA family protein [Rhizomicrobium sp.]